MPTKRLPAKPHLDELKRQARDLLAESAAGVPSACQRIREFHPRYGGASDEQVAEAHLGWSDGLFIIAREYGFGSWPRLRHHVLSQSSVLQHSHTDRIADPVFRAAVQAIEDGEVDALRHLLDEHPDLTQQHVEFEGENYFRKPSLLAFIAENPVRTDSLPPNIVEITKLLLERGAGANQANLDETLGLVATGRVPREAGVQHELIELLCSAGADPNRPLISALAHGEFAAAMWLLDCGARKTLPITAVLQGADSLARQLRSADKTERQISLALAAQHGRTGALKVLLNSGADPSSYNPAGVHSHSTPLHQAALNGHEDAVRVLLEHGADQNLRDTMWNGTPLDWARHARQPRVIALFESK